MSRIRKFAIAGSTFSIAMAIGFVMQNGDALASRMVSESDLPPGVAPPMQMPQQAGVAAMIPNLPRLTAEAAPDMSVPQLAPAPEPPAPTVALAAATTQISTPQTMTDAQPDRAEDAIQCAPDLTGRAGAAATVVLSLDAPCSADSVVTIHHQGMIFSILTDSEGRAQTVVPALAENAIFIAELPADAGAAAIVTVPDLQGYDRAVLQWQGETGLQFHALEFGADYQENGHVWAAATRDVESSLSGQGGFLITLGAEGVENAFHAEVYTFPTGAIDRSGEVDLSVEAEVLPTTCGREIAAQTIQLSPGAEPYSLDLTMTLPGCESVGEFLVLNNMLESLTLAGR